MRLFPRPPAAPHAAITRAVIDLGLRTLARLALDRPEVNVVLSPSGLGLALGAAYLGASGATRDDLARGLDLLGRGTTEAEAGLREWHRASHSWAEDDPLNLAVSLWLPAGSIVDPGYLERVQRLLEAEAAVLSRDELTARDQVNRWAARSTRGRISPVLDRIDPSALLTLLTVVDLDARWETAFDPEYTRPSAFHVGAGRSIQVPTMMQSGEYSHFRTDEIEGVALDFAGGRRRIVILLPTRDRPLDGALSALDGDAWRHLVRKMRRMQGTVALPRVALGGTLSLDAPLSDLGLSRVFDPQRAEFPAFGRHSAVGRLAQTIRLEIAEEGVQASAITLMIQVVAAGSARPAHFEMHVDRPFVLAVEDPSSGALHFLAAVRDPHPPGR